MTVTTSTITKLCILKNYHNFTLEGYIISRGETFGLLYGGKYKVISLEELQEFMKGKESGY